MIQEGQSCHMELRLFSPRAPGKLRKQVAAGGVLGSVRFRGLGLLASLAAVDS